MTFSSLNDISFLHNKKLAPSCNYNPFSRRYHPQSAITFRNRLTTPAVSYRTLTITISRIIRNVCYITVVVKPEIR